MSPNSSRMNVVYFPQLGYLLALPLRNEEQDPQEFAMEGFEFQVRAFRTLAGTQTALKFAIL